MQKHISKYKIHINQKYEINWEVVKTVHLNIFTRTHTYIYIYTHTLFKGLEKRQKYRFHQKCTSEETVLGTCFGLV